MSVARTQSLDTTGQYSAHSELASAAITCTMHCTVRGWGTSISGTLLAACSSAVWLAARNIDTAEGATLVRLRLQLLLVLFNFHMRYFMRGINSRDDARQPQNERKV